jgi:hypothetical protein
MGRLIVLSLFTFLVAVTVQAQEAAETPAEESGPDVVELAVDWVDRMNGLSNWFLSMDGSEDQVDRVVDRMMELFAPDVLAEVPPHDEKQIGPVLLRGADQFRLWVDKVARSQVDIEYKLQLQTQSYWEGEPMVYSKPLPWGGVGLSFRVNAVYKARKDRTKYLEYGAVFLQYNEDGKIDRLRFLLSEKSEVVDSPDDQI